MKRFHQIAVTCAILVGLSALAIAANESNFVGLLKVQSSDASSTCTIATADGEACVAGDLETKANFRSAGTSALVGAVTASSTVTVTGALAGLKPNQATGASITISAPADCGGVYFVSTDNAVVQLPAGSAATLGCCITVVNAASNGGALVSISPGSSDAIYGSRIVIAAANSVSTSALSGATNKDMQNTKSTAIKGDRATVCNNGSTSWFAIDIYGIWASES